MMPKYAAVLGVLVAIAITASMDATGLSMFSALPLLPLFVLFWYHQRLSFKSLGLQLGRLQHYAIAVFYPVSVVGALVFAAWALGPLECTKVPWQEACFKSLRVAAATFVAALLTEEGFFRGWLWASLQRAGQKPCQVLIWSSAAFALWHLSSVVLDTGFNPPMAQVPVFIVNAATIGLVWGLLREASGSIVVTSVSHGLWNGLAYVFFGFGRKVGALGIVNSVVLGPEVGVLGLGLNAVFAFVFWRWFRCEGKAQ
jgi:membrane protease YdiL (CAAX protease family)